MRTQLPKPRTRRRMRQHPHRHLPRRLRLPRPHHSIRLGTARITNTTLSGDSACCSPMPERLVRSGEGGRERLRGHELLSRPRPRPSTPFSAAEQGSAAANHRGAAAVRCQGTAQCGRAPAALGAHRRLAAARDDQGLAPSS